MAVCLPSCSLAPKADVHQTVRTCPAQLLARLLPEMLSKELSMVAHLKRSMREPRKLRKLLCLLMWLSSSSLILPKTYRREKKGSVTPARAWHLGKQLHILLLCRDQSCPKSIIIAQLAPKAVNIHPLCAIPHGKAPQQTPASAHPAHRGAGTEQTSGKATLLSSPQQGSVVGGKGCERPSCHGNRSMKDLRSTEFNCFASVPLLCYGQHPSTALAAGSPERAGGAGTRGAGSWSWNLPKPFALVWNWLVMPGLGRAVQTGWGKAQ